MYASVHTREHDSDWIDSCKSVLVDGRPAPWNVRVLPSSLKLARVRAMPIEAVTDRFSSGHCAGMGLHRAVCVYRHDQLPRVQGNDAEACARRNAAMSQVRLVEDARSLLEPRGKGAPC